MLDKHNLSIFEKRLFKAKTTHEKEEILKEALNHVDEAPGFEWGNAHLHVRNFGSLRSSWQTALKGLAEGVTYLEISDFFDPYGYRGNFEKACKLTGIVPIASAELIAVIDDDFNRKIKAELGINSAEKLKVNGRTPGRIYIIISGYNPWTNLSKKSLERLESIIKNQSRRVLDIASKAHLCLKQRLGYGIDGDAVKKHRLVQERHVAEAAFTAIRTSDKNLDEELRKLEIDIPEGTHWEDKEVIEDEIRRKLFSKPGQPCYIRQTEAEFYSLSEMFELLQELNGILKLPVILNGPDYSDVDDEPESLERFCEILGVKAQSWVSHEVDPAKAKRYTQYFYDRGYLVDVGTEHNDSRDRQIKPRYRDGSQIGLDLWKLLNRGVYVDLAQMWHEIKFTDPDGRRTKHSIDECSKVGRDLAKRQNSE